MLNNQKADGQAADFVVQAAKVATYYPMEKH